MQTILQQFRKGVFFKTIIKYVCFQINKCVEKIQGFFSINITLYFSGVMLCFRLNHKLLQKLNHLKFAFYPHEPHFNTLQGWPGCLEEFQR